MGNICHGEEKHETLKRDIKVSNGRMMETPDNKATVVICAMDYKLTENALTCTYDGRNMQELCQACNINDVTYLTDEQEPLTKEYACSVIVEKLSALEAGDTFVFYYSGHGTNLANEPGAPDDEEEQDEAYCFQDEDGQVNYESCLSDDDFAGVITENAQRGVNVIVLSDCCHSDTICDFSKPSWRGIQSVSISGCEDSQTSGDIGTGGIFTHSMLCAIQKIRTLQDAGGLDGGAYSIGMLFNVTLYCKQNQFPKAAQNLCIENSRSMTTSKAPWPFIPEYEYIAPLNKKSRGVGGVNTAVPPAVEAEAVADGDQSGSGALAFIGKVK